MKTIQVKRKHIKLGLQGDCRQCPIALALAECGLTEVLVQKDQASYRTAAKAGFRKYRTVKLGARAKCFIRKFDKRRSSVKPFNFRIDV